MKKLFSLLLACILVSACASFPEAKANGNPLLIGKIVLNMYSSDLYAKAPESSMTTHGMQFTVFDNQSYQTATLFTNDDGMFATDRFPPGDYLITTLSVKKEYIGTIVDLSYKVSGGWYFQIKENAVNNIGVINWNYRKSNGSSAYTFAKEYDEVLNYFKEKYEDSKWWDNEAANIDLSGKS